MINFDEATHTYTDSDTGEIIPSVSQVLKAVYGNKYGNVPADILKRAQDYGNFIHNMIEEYEKTGQTSIADELDNYIIIRPYFYKYLSSEQVIGGKKFGVCGKYDLMFKGVLNSQILVDIKTNTKLDKDYVQRQLSLYMYIHPDIKLIKYLYCLWINKDHCELIPIEYLGDDWCKETIRKYYAGETAEEPQQELELFKDNDLALELSNTLDKIAELELKSKEIKAQIKEEMESRGITKITIPHYTISFVAESERKSLDSTAIKAEQPELYERYLNTSKVSGSIKITKKGK